MNTLSAIVIAAQDVEIQPFLDILTGSAEIAQGSPLPELYATASRVSDLPAPTGRAWLAHTSNGRLLVLRTDIGMVATASALGWALTQYKPKCVVSIGSAGGLAPQTNVLDLVAGTTYTYGTADATAFGYKAGQVPGQPATFASSPVLAECLPANVASGLMLSGDSFITEKNVGDMRERFPAALTTDMESTAAAQTCTTWGIPFISLRCISDLCGPAANQDYHVAVERAAYTSAVAASSMLHNFWSRQTQGRSPLFGRPAIDGALLLVLARVHRLDPLEDLSHVPTEILTAIRQQLTAHPSFTGEALGLVAAAVQEISNNPSITLTAKKYDNERARLVSALGISSDRGQIAWPPTSQTVSKRSNGYWNDALASLGIQVKTGRQRGTVKFSPDDYRNAMSSFMKWAQNEGTSASVASYSVWLKRENATGAFPSSAAIRQHFGTWRSAIDTANV